MRRALIGLVILGICVSGEAGAASLTALLQRVTFVQIAESPTPPGNQIGAPIATALGATVVKSVPTLSASSGLRYAFDPQVGVFVRERHLSGPLLLERAEPIGAGAAALAFAYERVAIDRFEGHALDHLREDRVLRLARIPDLHIGLTADQFSLSGTYGIGDGEVNLLVPVVRTALSVATQRSDSSFDAPQAVRLVRVAAQATHTGVGDIQVRGKYRIGAWSPADLSLGLVLRLPSGRAADFQGTDTVTIAPTAYLSTRPFAFAHDLSLQAHLNARADLNAEAVDRSSAAWGIALDLRWGEWATGSLSVLGRHDFARVARPGFFDVARLDLRTGRTRVAPLFGFRGERVDAYDLAVGGRVNVWGDALVAFATAILPLNDAGARADVIPLVGLEVGF